MDGRLEISPVLLYRQGCNKQQANFRIPSNRKQRKKWRFLLDGIRTFYFVKFYFFSETDLDHSDIDTRMKVMKDQLKERERMAAKLRRALKKQTEFERKKELKIHESTLRKQIEQFDNMILQAQSQLRNLEEFDQIGVKPKIRSPRKESGSTGG